MSEKVERDSAGEVKSANGRPTALSLMMQALVQIDGDTRIPAIVGARLQLAIDSLEHYFSSAFASDKLH